MSTNHQINQHSTGHRTATFTSACLRSCRKLVSQIQRAKERIVAEFQGTVQEHAHLLELAVNEAEALAWQSGYPHLLFPTLAEENARAVAQWHERQNHLREKRPALAIAA